MTLSIVIPCFNEESTLERCVEAVLAIAHERLQLEVVIVDDASTDASAEVAQTLVTRHSQVRLQRHAVNQGKGAALRTGFREVTGDFVAVQDADLEYDPSDLRRLVEPLARGDADVVLGSRFLSSGAHRVLYFWHSLGNRFLTFLSNMFTDLNLTDMETCYKVFRREVIQGIEINENRFGFEPEVVAKIAHLRLRIYEMGISYHGRTYAEGKKIGMRDGFRALYCILRYNAHRAPLPIQFLLYLFIGGVAAVANLGIFLGLYASGSPVTVAAPVAFVLAAGVNYLLCIWLLFRRNVKWRTPAEVMMYVAVVGGVCVVDLAVTAGLLGLAVAPAVAKLTAAAVGLVLNFAGRRFLVFPEPATGPWRPSQASTGGVEELRTEDGPTEDGRSPVGESNREISTHSNVGDGGRRVSRVSPVPETSRARR